MKTIVELDDLWDSSLIEKYLVPLRELNPNFIANVFCIPNKLGEAGMLRKVYPWIRFYIHGFEHTHFECGEWTEEKAHALIGRALEMGYEPVFKAPNYLMDDETGKAVANLGCILVNNPTYQPEVPGLVTYPNIDKYPRHTRICAHLVWYPRTNDFIEEHPWFVHQSAKEVEEFASIEEIVHAEA